MRRSGYFVLVAAAMLLVAPVAAQVENAILSAGGAVHADGSVFVFGDLVIGRTGVGAPLDQGVIPCWQVTPCFGDVDGDGQIGLVDLAFLLTNFGLPSGATPEQGDLDVDGDVDLTDLANLLIVFGLPCE